MVGFSFLFHPFCIARQPWVICLDRSHERHECFHNAVVRVRKQQAQKQAERDAPDHRITTGRAGGR